MKLRQKFMTVGIAGIFVLSLAVSAWAAEPQVVAQKIRAGGVNVTMPLVSGAVGGTDVDDKINLTLDFNLVKKFYNYLPGCYNDSQMEASYYGDFSGTFEISDSRAFVNDVAVFINSQLQNRAKSAHKAGSHIKKYTFDSRYQVHFNSEELLSLEQTYTDYLGGAHPNHYLDTLNVDLKTGKVLRLDDLFKNGSDDLSRLNIIVAQQVEAERDIKGFFEEEIVINGTENFYITDNEDLVIIYPPYAVAPYASGIVEFIIPISEVADIFNFTFE